MTEPQILFKEHFNKKFLLERAWNLRRKYFTRPLKVKNESFHEAIGPLLVIAQVFCSMPVSGILSDNTNNVQFTWCSIKIIYLFAIVMLGTSEGLFIFRQSFNGGFTFRSVEPCLFYFMTILTILLFLRLAQKWEALIKYWRGHEDVFLRDPYNVQGMRLKLKMRIFAGLFMFLALTEHLVFLLANIMHYRHETQRCNLVYDSSFIEFYFVHEHAEIFERVPYNLLFGLIIKWTNIVLTFAWSWTDIFIVCISFGLTTRFNQLNNRVHVSFDKAKTSMFWMEIRKHYSLIINLLYVVDNEIAFLIILSCSSNLYYICYKLFNSFTNIPDPLNKFYFWYSLIFLIVRTLSVLLAAALVNDASKASLKIIRDIPTNSWNFELQRFTDLLTDDFVALSGRRFFFLTRRTILAMIGTVVTYEIVLLDQLKEIDRTEDETCVNLTRFSL